MADKLQIFLRCLRFLSIAAFTIGLTACLDGDDGKDGAPGQAAPPLGVDIANATEINAKITGVTIASPPVVDFTLTDGNGNAVKNLSATALDLTFAKLTPGTDGNASAWQNYINRIENAPIIGPGEPQTQGWTEKGKDGTLVENFAGNYTYIYATDVTNVTDPFPVPYNPSLTHRAGFEIRGFVQVHNPTFTFRPSDNATDGVFTRKMVKTESCNVCHENLSKHGSARFEIDYCQTCHNPGTTDADTGNSLDLKVMIHKIHRGKDLPSVVAGGDYCIDGFFTGLLCYNDLAYPQDIRNCSNCHNENDPETPEAANWYKVPTAEACGSCHDDVNFETGAGHVAGPRDNSSCTSCHSPDTTSSLGAFQKHRILTQEGADRYSFNILRITFLVPGTAPVVTFSVTDPTNNDAPYDLSNDAILMASDLRFYVAWDTAAYTNPGNNNSGATSTSVYSGGVLQAIDNGDFSYTLTLSAVRADATGSGIVTFAGKVTEAIGDLPVTSTHRFFSITDNPLLPIPSRLKVDLERCDGCHQRLGFHGNRNQNLQACAMCHNSAAARGGTPSRGPMDFKSFIHRKHAVDSIRYPQRVSNCVACHTDDGFYPVTIDSGVLSTSVNRGDPGAPPPAPDSTDPTDNNRISPNSATCSVCHSSASAQIHMEQNGGNFDVCQEIDGTMLVRVDFCGPAGNKNGTIVQEGCTTCHAKGRIADVAVTHSLDLD